ncbi:MAG TPA: histone deacetylase [Verrucomicrobiales bacterium]|nr:histone deacetylase [Verrucomicrobiales bacterium]
MTAPLSTGLLLDPLFLKHDPGPGHPESPRRYAALTAHFQESGLTGRTVPIPLRSVEDEDLALCHHPAYIELVRREISSGRSDLSTGDTSVCPETLEVALAAVGSVLSAVDQVMDGRLRNAFCAVRPPGHHATASRGMGFCVFNNVALAARHAIQRHGLERILIADWDVHHGNGTQDIFYEDPTVFFFSTHQWPLYPGTGAARETGSGRGAGTTLNRPFPAGSGFEQIGGVFREELLPRMQEFKPQLVLLSAGFDSRAGDPLGGFTLTDDDFRALTRIVLEIATEQADGKLISVLEGGYNIEGLPLAAAAHLETLAG